MVVGGDECERFFFGFVRVVSWFRVFFLILCSVSLHVMLFFFYGDYDYDDDDDDDDDVITTSYSWLWLFFFMCIIGIDD
jgi:hypothetical protein